METYNSNNGNYAGKTVHLIASSNNKNNNLLYRIIKKTVEGKMVIPLNNSAILD